MSTNAGTAVATASKETDFVLLNALPQEMVAKAQILQQVANATNAASQAAS